MHLLSITGKMYFQITGSNRFKHNKIANNKTRSRIILLRVSFFDNNKISLTGSSNNGIRIKFITFK